MNNDFLSGLWAFGRAVSEVLRNQQIRRWYRSAFFKIILLAVVVLAGLIGAGSYFLWNSFEQAWASVLVVLAWIIVILYLSGTFARLLLSTLFMVFAGEQSLLRALGFKVPPGLATVSSRRTILRLYRAEYTAIFRSVVFGLLALPAMFVPLLLPFALMLIAWAMGAEALRSAHRVLAENSFEVADKSIPTAFTVGIGLVPSVLGAVPLVGWAALPVLQLAAILALQSSNPVRDHSSLHDASSRSRP